MTNPNNAVGANAAYNTRTSVDAFGDSLQLFNGSGVLSGWTVRPSSGMVVSVGGVAGIRDVAIAEDNMGNRLCIDNRSGLSIDMEIEAASVSSARYSAIVVYANKPAQAADNTPDAPSICGMIEAKGDATGVTEAQIRAAITADGGTGSIAYYAVLATVYVGAGTTVITSANIKANHVGISSEDLIADNSIEDSQIKWNSLGNHYDYKDNFASGDVADVRPFSYVVPSAGVYSIIFSIYYAPSANAIRTITVMRGDANDWSNRLGQFTVVAGSLATTTYVRAVELNAGDLLTARMVANSADFHPVTASWVITRIG